MPWSAMISGLAMWDGVHCNRADSDFISCVTGINAYVIAFTALAAGTSWPDLVASNIAVECQITADSAIANITCSNSVNIYVGIGIPWLIDTAYTFIASGEPLRIENADELSFPLLVFFSTSVGSISVRSLEALGFGPGLPVYSSCCFGRIIFVVLSSPGVSGII
ncbi:hypothetical protein CRYUN_Cryun20dG0061700 [Craigia yunnanensis]